MTNRFHIADVKKPAAPREYYSKISPHQVPVVLEGAGDYAPSPDEILMERTSWRDFLINHSKTRTRKYILPAAVHSAYWQYPRYLTSAHQLADQE